MEKKYLISGRFYSWDNEDSRGDIYRFVGFSFDGKTFGDVMTRELGKDKWRYGAMKGTISEDFKGRLCTIYGKVSDLRYASWQEVASYLSHYRKVSAETKDATISSSKPISLIRTPEYTEAIFKVKEFIRP